MTIVPAERQQTPATYAAARATHGGALSLSHMSPREAWTFCESLAATPLLPDAYRKQPASVLWAMEYGRALGLDVVTTITTIHVIKGKPCQSADLMLGRARSAGHRVRIKSERTRCVVSIQRHDDPDDETVIEWTLDDAVTAGLCTLRDGRPYSRDDKNRPQPWERFPRAMLRARAIAECVRSACPEVLHGAIYTPEELGEVVDQDGNPVVALDRADAPVQQTATVVQSTPNSPPRDFLAEAQQAADAATVRVLWSEAKQSGAPADYLDQLAAVGREVAARAEAMAAAESGDPEPADVVTEVAAAPADIAHHAQQAQDATERAAADAEQALRLAASRAHLPDLDAAFERVVGLPIEQAPAAQLHAFRQQIEAAAKGAQQ
ncbi:recombinase RecT [Streptomyces sp. NPDC001279]|uniref:recombinase RecT n=1 Tax=Streptomyces sp. NPDC001279 TaxID=3364556 RepID=UPI0036CD3E96